MNGRIYDPRIARFLNADPVVQQVENLQNLNRYSYVLNNPLNATDPTGYFLNSVLQGVMAYLSGASVAESLQIAAASYAAGDDVQFTYSSASGFSAGEGQMRSIESQAFDSFELGGQGSNGVEQAKAEARVDGGSVTSGVSGVGFSKPTNGSGVETKGLEPSVGDAIEMSRWDAIDNRKLAEDELMVLFTIRKINPNKKFLSHKAAAKSILTIIAPISAKYGLEIGGEISEERHTFTYSYPKVGKQGGMRLSDKKPTFHTHPNGTVGFSTGRNLNTEGSNTLINVGDVYNTNRAGGKTSYMGQLLKNGEVYVGMCEPGACDNDLQIERGTRVH